MLANTYLTGWKMKRLGTSVVCAVVLASLLGACGPALEDAELSGAEAKEPNPETFDPDAFEFAEPGMVQAQTLLGDLGGAVGSPVATYEYISTASNQWSVSCNGGSSRDIAYVWTAPATGSFTFSTGGSNFDTVLQIRHYSNTSSVMGCDDDTSTTLQSSITLSGLVKGVRLLIIIEGYAAEYGTLARLNIRKN
ncbi:hypothetical protein [Pyxidicoccus xibeiensis]|uniref:hypothetical protein n=1 Tax=Pyxidicoccus xibeiensis TaxID=2906759 RepID=UPI0020A80911|nr:hypothetical protein [Pyxidicoccus xibeiensis]MCP3139438.1 hypothetical protein [Pyxidicoccus xibeiensis]